MTVGFTVVDSPVVSAFNNNESLVSLASLTEGTVPFNIIANGSTIRNLAEYGEPRAQTVVEINGERRLVTLQAPPRGFSRFPNRAAINNAISKSDAAIVFASKNYYAGPYFDEIVSVYRPKTSLFFWGPKRPIALVLVKEKLLNETVTLALNATKDHCEAIKQSLNRFLLPACKSYISILSVLDLVV